LKNRTKPCREVSVHCLVKGCVALSVCGKIQTSVNTHFEWQTVDVTERIIKSERDSILIVEDSRVFTKILAGILDTVPIKYTIATNGEAAINACHKEEFALILMDIKMPKMDGMEATKNIRTISEYTSTMPIIAVTALISEEQTKQYFEAGMTAVIKKPISSQSLYEVLSKHMGLAENIAILKCNQEELRKIKDAVSEGTNTVNMDTVAQYTSLLKADFLPLLREYLIAGPDEISKLGEAIRENDLKQVEFLAHKFKSTSHVFGAQGVFNLSAQIEIASRNGTLAEHPDLFSELHIQFELTKAILEKYGRQKAAEAREKAKQ